MRQLRLSICLKLSILKLSGNSSPFGFSFITKILYLSLRNTDKYKVVSQDIHSRSKHLIIQLPSKVRVSLVSQSFIYRSFKVIGAPPRRGVPRSYKEDDQKTQGFAHQDPQRARARPHRGKTFSPESQTWCRQGGQVLLLGYPTPA